MRDPWEEKAANDLKAQIKHAGVTYAQLVALLSAEGVELSAPGLTKKLYRGAFSYAFYLRCGEILRTRQRGTAGISGGNL